MIVNPGKVDVLTGIRQKVQFEGVIAGKVTVGEESKKI